MVAYLLDSNLIIDYARGYEPTIRYLRATLKEGDKVFMSVITETELFAGKSFAKLEQFLAEEFHAIPLIVDSSIARRAGALRREREITISDALIAATALEHNLTFITRNSKHFQGIPELNLIFPA